MLFPRNILKKPRDKVGFEINGFSFFLKDIFILERERERQKGRREKLKQIPH